MKGTASIERQLIDLPKLDRAALEQQHKRLHGKAAPEEFTDDLLRMSVACRLQQQLVARFRSRMYQVLTATDAISSSVIDGSQNTILLGQWKGKIHEVTILEDGAMYQGDYYDSLQKLVESITGGKKSIAEFFGQSEQAPRHGR